MKCARPVNLFFRSLAAATQVSFSKTKQEVQHYFLSVWISSGICLKPFLTRVKCYYNERFLIPLETLLFLKLPISNRILRRIRKQNFKPPELSRVIFCVLN